MGLVEAALSGDKRAALIALRDRLAQEIEATTSGRDLAALSRQFTEVVKLLDEMPNEKEVSPADEIAQRRAERRKRRDAEAQAQPGT